MIDPACIAFDVDGVFADAMTLFLDIARDEFRLNEFRYEDITCYALEECIDMDTKVIAAIIERILDGNHAAPLRPVDGAPEVLTRLGRKHAPLLFVTARPYPGPISNWIQSVLSLDAASIEIVATGSFEAKAEVLLSRKISYFVEDRLETCFFLKEFGITPVLFKQPWNRKEHPFIEIGNWKELEAIIAI
jgi:5'(3')-deoxyribonucleotidase